MGAERLREAIDAVLDYAERRTRACLAALADGEREAEDVLEAPEGDLLLRLRATVEGERLVLDFAGSAAQHAGNLNCPLAVTRSACLFAVRVLTDPDIPPVGGRLPADRGARARGLAAERPPRRRPAVAAGNVETSSRVADLVLGAFGRALGQGTMNNLTLGDEPLLLLRDARRRPGRVRGRGRPERRARGDEQHAQHADRGARARIPGARGRVRAAPRLGRRRAPPRRRRRRARAARRCAR